MLHDFETPNNYWKYAEPVLTKQTSDFTALPQILPLFVLLGDMGILIPNLRGFQVWQVIKIRRILLQRKGALMSWHNMKTNNEWYQYSINWFCCWVRDVMPYVKLQTICRWLQRKTVVTFFCLTGVTREWRKAIHRSFIHYRTVRFIQHTLCLRCTLV